jgi:hypothetical protein
MIKQSWWKIFTVLLLAYTFTAGFIIKVLLMGRAKMYALAF